MYNVQIIGTGSYAPINVMKNSDITQFVETSDEWISNRIGIKERRISTGEGTTDLSVEAAKAAIESANISPKDIDLIVVGTCTPDNFIPSTACLIQREIGAVNSTCFDLSAACTGFIYGISVATQFIRTGQNKTVLVIGAETLSRGVDWTDRGTCVLFGDGAGAAILTRAENEEQGVISIYTGADGNGAEFLEYPAVPLKNTFVEEVEENNSIITMQGGEVFKFAVKIIVECIEKVLQDSDYSIEDIDYIVPHQANMKIIDVAAKKLGIDKEKFFMNISKYGNTSGASIPLALDEMEKANMLKKGDKIIMVGFGGGLTYGAVLINWNK
ncbi:ketoacyl-ACP synthase III [Clostridium sediminicola]|uniref:beta-ketoacyl-ACP synthase III n=1 Tax=Clostridium sediminicola TaxID=3114879 RepID=UPI0031F2308E